MATVHRRSFLASLTLLPAVVSACAAGADEQPPGTDAGGQRFEITKTKAEWRETLTPQQFRVLREHDTERPGSSPLNDEHRSGTYPLRRLRSCVVLVGREVREWHRMAELHLTVA
jgi:hypothetical protein